MHTGSAGTVETVLPPFDDTRQCHRLWPQHNLSVKTWSQAASKTGTTSDLGLDLSDYADYTINKQKALFIMVLKLLLVLQLKDFEEF